MNCKKIHGLLTLLLMMASVSLLAQTSLSGVIKDVSDEPLIGASVLVKGTVVGTVSDYDGSYELTTSIAPPFTLVVSYVGYESQEKEVTESATLDFTLVEQSAVGSEVVVSASRKPEKIIESPVSIERMDASTIRNTASANFYDAIENLKGVQMGTNSLTFKSVNTRGFATFANTRFVQLIDGVDNAAPGLNFPAGNLTGIPELDVNSVELLPGAASALYGANAFNGVLLMTSKDPFLQPGLSVSIKGGVTEQKSGAGTNPYGDFAIRYAKPFGNKVALKLNFSALQGTDWVATDYSDVYGRKTKETDFDGVNLYGDEIATSLTLANPAAATDPDAPKTITKNIARTGYKEVDLLDDGGHASSIKFGASLHWKVAQNAELSYGYKMGQGQTLYQGANRFRLTGITMETHHVELKGSNYFLRGYLSKEDAGRSYDTKFLAWNMNRAFKGDRDWFMDYTVAWNGIENTVAAINPAFVALIPQSLKDLLPGYFNDAQARDFADGNALNASQLPADALAFLNAAAPAIVPGATGWTRNAHARPEPGSVLFNSTRDRIANLADLANGSKLVDYSKMYHAEGMYNLAPHIGNFMDIQLGGSYRVFRLDSEGTVFNDGPDGFNKEIQIDEYGAYLQASKALMEDRLKLSASVRYDKSGNFDGQFSPRASVVYSAGSNKQHNFRASWQTGFRNPATQPQYINLDMGPLTLLGTTQDNFNHYTSVRNYGTGQTATLTGERVKNESYTFGSLLAFGASGDPSVLKKANVEFIKPEKITVYEVGYKGLPMKKLFVDINGYYNTYKDFMADYRVATPYTGSMADGSSVLALAGGNYTLFQLYGNANADVSSYGMGLNVEYSLPRKFKVGANYSYAKLIFDAAANPDFRPGFNTPEHKFKIMFGNSNIYKGLGFNVSYRWSDAFDWQASFGDGKVEAYSTVDAQISYKVPAIKSTFKLGAANLLNKEYKTAFGAARVGRQIYFGITYDDLFR